MRRWILLLTAPLLWCAAALHYHNQRVRATNPARLVAALEKDLAARIRSFEVLTADPGVAQALRQAASNTAPVPLAPRLEREPYALFVYHGTRLTLWNTGTMAPPEAARSAASGGYTLVSSPTGAALLSVKTVPLPAADTAPFRLVALLPVKESYPLDNEYLQPRFPASDAIPSGVEVRPYKSGTPRLYPVRGPGGAVLFGLYLPAGEVRAPLPDGAVWALTGAGLLAALVWLHRLFRRLARRCGAVVGSVAAAVTIIGLRLLSYALPLPFRLRDTEIFSSGLYAYSGALPSLGDLFLNALGALWLAAFIATRRARGGGGWQRPKSAVLCWLSAGFCAAASGLAVFGTVRLVQSLVVDSQLSFDVARFPGTTAYTVLGFVILGILSAALALVVGMLGAGVRRLTSPVVQPLLIGGLSIAVGFFLFAQYEPLTVVAVAVWTAAAGVVLQRPRVDPTVPILAPRLVAYMVLLSASMAALLHGFVQARTYKKDLVAFARQVSAQGDPLTEYTFGSAATAVPRDAALAAFLRRPTPEARAGLVQRLSALYLGPTIEGYRPEFFLFDAAGRPLFNRDTTTLAALERRFGAGMPTTTPELAATPGAGGRHYLARLPVRPPAGYGSSPVDTSPPLGTVLIDLSLRETAAQTVYPEILQSAAVSQAQRAASYPYALYTGTRLLTQTDDFPASPPPPAAVGKDEEPRYRLWAGRRQLLYPAGDSEGTVAVVVGPERGWLPLATHFSYLFAVLLALAGAAGLYRFGGRPRRRRGVWGLSRMTLRQGIQLSILGLVAVSLVAVGVVTVSLFNRRYRESTRLRLQSETAAVARAVQTYLRTAGSGRLPTSLDSLGAGASPDGELRFFLAGLAETQKADINLFSADGRLVATSGEEIYARGLLPRLARPEALRAVRSGARNLLQEEAVGSFTYLSAYAPLRAEDGSLAGFINVPFFASQRELNNQISGILVTLVNLYAVLFLLAGGLAYFITRGLTRALSAIIERFGRLGLQGNETVEWPYDDEIGLLVREYNKMVRTVEQSAAALARSERENAWREMARQVAHEIKNPLTPMKLQIQYLQKALVEGRPDVHALAGRVSNTLVEQIDTLSRIASEFSDFARMPETRPERVDLGAALNRVAALYEHAPGVEVSVELPQKTVTALCDRDQLQRTITNLLQNAVQALGEGRPGRIRVALESAGGRATIAVEDNGRGIPTAEQPRIFQPYFTTKGSGTGLGLAMSRQMVEGWGGSVWFESEEGVGTTFFVELKVV